MSLPGHPGGAGRTITFQFYAADVIGNASRKALVVDAWGPVGGASLLGPLNSATVAEVSWQILAGNTRAGFPQTSSGCCATGGFV